MTVPAVILIVFILKYCANSIIIFTHNSATFELFFGALRAALLLCYPGIEPKSGTAQ
jgi:hypothetical protein